MRPDLEQLISKEQALERLLSAWSPEPSAETVSLEQAAGRVLAEDQFARYDFPMVRASAMDGVAVHSQSFAGGMPDTAAWKLGRDFVRADTGDDFDDAFDAVIAIENVELTEEGGLRFTHHVNAPCGMNVKPCGSEVRRGALLVPKGRRLRAQDLAAIAMGGITQVPVVTRPRVAFLPTGSELIPPDRTPERGQNFDTNSILAAQMLRDMGAEPVLHPIVPDDPARLEQALDSLLARADIVLLNAGTSKGGEDFCGRLLKKRGRLLFQGVAAVPGRPMTAAMIGNTPVVNLSGPPYAAFYSMDWAVRALVCQALGIPAPVRETVAATLAAPLQTPPFFSLMVPLRVTRQEDGGFLAVPLVLRGPRSAGSAAALTADGVYISTPGEPARAAGESLTIELLRSRSELSASEPREG